MPARDGRISIAGCDEERDALAEEFGSDRGGLCWLRAGVLNYGLDCELAVDATSGVDFFLPDVEALKVGHIDVGEATCLSRSNTYLHGAGLTRCAACTG